MPRRSELRITKRTVDALTVDATDGVFWDRDLAGFGVRVHATGRKVYVVQSRGPAGPKRVTLGRHGDMSTEEARKRAAVVIDRIKRGEDPVPAPPEPELTLTVRTVPAHPCQSRAPLQRTGACSTSTFFPPWARCQSTR